jgi:vitamin B12/bleomycin/antimicrobial peptide transport system ATP-binding/permease protein
MFGTFISTSVFGKVLMRLYNQLLKQEGDMRFSMVRVRENAESIAFYSGERQERRVVAERFNAVVNTVKTRIRWHAYYSLWNNMYAYATVLVPSLLTAPR